MDISHLKKQAKALVKAYPELVSNHPQEMPLHTAQRTIAKLQGYPSWEALVAAAHAAVSTSHNNGRAGKLSRDRVCVVRVTLLRTDPLVWRQVEVPCDYSFWDLHVAIQDAIGWSDSHLHEFELPDGLQLGIPEQGDNTSPAVWEHDIADHLSVGMDVGYLYDFGDMWRHQLQVMEEKPRGVGRYPRCTGGASLAPPDDCGGWSGWEEVKEVMAGPKDEEYRELRDWLKGWGRRYIPLDPLKFDPRKVKFDNPAARFRAAFGDHR